MMQDLIFNLRISDLKQIINNAVKEAVQRYMTQPENNHPEFLNIDQVAEIIGRKKSTIYGLVHRRQIPYIKNGKNLLFSYKEIIQWVNSGRQDTMNEIIEKKSKELADRL